jgi:hypothetical protein
MGEFRPAAGGTRGEGGVAAGEANQGEDGRGAMGGGAGGQGAMKDGSRGAKLHRYFTEVPHLYRDTYLILRYFFDTVSEAYQKYNTIK